MTKKRTGPRRHSTFIHTVDRNDLIIDVNANWLRFARENDAPHLTRQAVIGCSLWDFIAGLETRHIYRLLMRKVRQDQRRIVFTYRCDSSTLHRYMQMEIVPAADQALEFKNYLLREESRDRVRLLDPTAERNHELLRMCSWCNRMRCDETWLSVEEAVNYLGLFGAPQFPQITHGICPDCALKFKDLA
ncbi:MAG: hypothetical protein KJ077_35655 [Anaerolineae bacterium]|nr:hypothetical protein [Anaerolineae bacterium]